MTTQVIVKQAGDDIVVLPRYVLRHGDRFVHIDEESVKRLGGDYTAWSFVSKEQPEEEITPFLDCRWFWRDGHRYTLSFIPSRHTVGEAITAAFGVLWDEEDRLVCHKSGEMEYDTIYETVIPVGYSRTWYRILSLQDVALNGPDHYNEIQNLGEVWDTFTKPRRGDPKAKTYSDAMLTFLRNYSEHISNKRFLAEYKKQHNAQ